jgi:hypothetical protein
MSAGVLSSNVGQGSLVLEGESKRKKRMLRCMGMKRDVVPRSATCGGTWMKEKCGSWAKATHFQPDGTSVLNADDA